MKAFYFNVVLGFEFINRQELYHLNHASAQKTAFKNKLFSYTLRFFILSLHFKAMNIASLCSCLHGSILHNIWISLTFPHGNVRTGPAEIPNFAVPVFGILSVLAWNLDTRR
jgi:hypothetical protein